MISITDDEFRSSLRVLVIDDDPGVAESLVEYLSDFGINAESEGSASKALERIRNSDYHVAVVDMRLPEMGGDTLILRAHDLSPDTGFLIATGSISFELTEALRRVGVKPEHVFMKPVPDMVRVVEAIEQLARSRATEG
jgi:DNA-binding NtrC family response regulator